MSRSAGQLIQRGPRHFVIRVYIGQDASGKRKYVNRTIRASKTDARQALTEMLRQRDLGMLMEPTYKTLNEYLDHWLDAAAKPRLQASTFEEYRAQLDRYVRAPLGDLKLTQVTPIAIQAVYAAMLGGGLSARTVRLTHAILRNALKQAVKWRVIPVNPADAVDLPKQQREEMRAMTSDEAARYLTAAQSSPHHVLLATLLSTGLRPSEAIALRWPDVDLPGARITVRRKAVRATGGWVYGPPKTSKGRRTVDLPQGIVALLAALPRHYEHVFHNADGDPPNLRGVVTEHKSTLERAGIDPAVRLYDLRHTHATLLLLAGVHPKIVSERLGHSTINITLDTYSHVLPGMQKESAQKLNAMLFENLPQQNPARAN